MSDKQIIAIWILFAVFGGAFAAAISIRDNSWHIWQLVSAFSGGAIFFVWSGVYRDTINWLNHEI